jgi:hypothetical protein
MTKLLPITIVFILLSCAPAKYIYPKGSYPTTPMEFASSKTFDEAWDRLVDVFAQKGLAIKIIDRSSGLIVSERSALPATIEDKFGKPINPDAFVVVPKFKNAGTNREEPISGTSTGVYAKKMIPNDVYGEWNVRIKKTATGSLINVNITNVTYNVFVNMTKTYDKRTLSEFKSTGVFENLLANLIK